MMKNIACISKNILLLSLGVAMLSACNLDINVNPNKPTSSDAEFLLPPAILKLTNYETVTLNELGSFFGGYWGKANDITIGGGGGTNSYLDMIINYSINDEFATQVWENAYTNIYNIKQIEDAELIRNPAYAGIAKIMRGWYYYRLVDHYNHVPFLEASNPSNPQPKYDQGADVYKAATDLVTAGIALLKDAPLGTKFPKADDILFNGNIGSWIKLANTLKLRALIRQSEVASGAYITEQMQVIQTEGSGFLTVDALVNPGYTTNVNQINGFWNAFYRTTNNNEVSAYRGYRPTRYLINAYKTLNDPRLAQIYVAVNNDYKGVVLGEPTNDVTQNYAVTSALKGPSENGNLPAGLLKSANQSSVIFSAAESYFLQAEAAQRGWLTAGSPKQYFDNAIKSSFDYLGLSVAAYTTYITQYAVKFEAAENPITRIIQQKWIALNGIDGAEAWNDYRRLGIPEAPGSLLASKDGAVHVVRLRYPASEVNNNPEQVAAQGNIVGTSPQFKVFWQK